MQEDARRQEDNITDHTLQQHGSLTISKGVEERCGALLVAYINDTFTSGIMPHKVQNGRRIMHTQLSDGVVKVLLSVTDWVQSAVPAAVSGSTVIGKVYIVASVNKK